MRRQRFNNATNYDNEEQNASFLAKIATASERREEKMKNQSVESEDADNLFTENQQIDKYNNFQKKTVGKSLLSPQNETYQTAEKTYISPFSEEYDEENNSSEEIITNNRIIFYCGIFLFLYLIVLGVGYHYTVFVEDVPQIITTEDREKSEYIEKIDEYILTLQNIQAETDELIDKYENDIVAENELNTLLQNDIKKITETTTDIKDIKAPDEFAKFHSRINEVYMLYANYCNSYTVFLKNQNDRTREELEKSFVKYNNASQELLEDYNNIFVKM